MESKEDFVGQQIGGSDVEIFDPNRGFILCKQSEVLNPDLPRAQRAFAVAKLSMGPPLELREFYYTLRGKPDLVKSFAGTKNIYAGVLEAIKMAEIICDINRDVFTVGNIPKGFIHYGHNSAYGNPEKPQGFTENLARTVLQDYDVASAVNIIHMEKMAAATRLVSSGFSQLTNSIITTTGGNFTRGVYVLTKRFRDEKNMMFFCDGDAFGNDMLRSLEYGTMASRHLTPEQAFPSRTYPHIFIAGLFPSVAESLNIPNDVEQKRPMSNPNVKRRVDFLKRYGLEDDKDMSTWERNKTYELEALSTSFRNTKDEPVGLAVYMLEFMRYNNIPCKPAPTDDDEDLKEEWKDAVGNSVDYALRWHAQHDSPASQLREVVNTAISGVVDTIVEELKNEVLPQFEEEVIEGATPESIRSNLMMQYQGDPRREKYSLADLADETHEIDVRVNWNAEELIKRVKDTVAQYIQELKTKGELYKHDVNVHPIEDVSGDLEDFYDIVLRELGVKTADAEKVRKALTQRLAD